MIQSSKENVVGCNARVKPTSELPTLPPAVLKAGGEAAETPFYLYVRNDPVNLVDPTGLSAVTSQSAGNKGWNNGKSGGSLSTMPFSEGAQLGGAIGSMMFGGIGGIAGSYAGDSLGESLVAPARGIANTFAVWARHKQRIENMSTAFKLLDQSVAEMPRLPPPTATAKFISSMFDDSNSSTLGEFLTSKPSLGGSLVPILGSGREAAYNFSEGNWGRGLMYSGLAVTDVFLVRSLATAGVKMVSRAGVREGGDLTLQAFAKNAVITETKVGQGALVHMAEKVVIKEVNPSANFITRWFGRKAIEEQVRGLEKLGDMAVNYLYKDGRLIMENAGKFASGTFSSAFGQIKLAGSNRLGMLMNDIWPRNVGATGKIFDPTLAPAIKAAYDLGFGALSSFGKAIGYYTDPPPTTRPSR